MGALPLGVPGDVRAQLCTDSWIRMVTARPVEKELRRDNTFNATVSLRDVLTGSNGSSGESVDAGRPRYQCDCDGKGVVL